MTKVLLADDNDRNLRLLEMSLKKEGFELLLARDGEEALKTYISQKPDLVIMDALMPKMDGFTVCRRMREHDPAKRVPIIISSAFHKQDASQQLDADVFLPKPIKPAELLETVRRLLEQ